MTLTPTKEQILDFVQTYRSSLAQSKNPHMDYFFRLEGATVSIYKSGKVLLQGNDLTPYLAFFGQGAGKAASASPVADRDRRGWKRLLFWWTHRRCIFCHSRPAGLASKAGCWGLKNLG